MFFNQGIDRSIQRQQELAEFCPTLSRHYRGFIESLSVEHPKNHTQSKIHAADNIQCSLSGKSVRYYQQFIAIFLVFLIIFVKRSELFIAIFLVFLIIFVKRSELFIAIFLVFLIIFVRRSGDSSESPDGLAAVRVQEFTHRSLTDDKTLAVIKQPTAAFFFSKDRYPFARDVKETAAAIFDILIPPTAWRIRTESLSAQRSVRRKTPNYHGKSSMGTGYLYRERCIEQK